MQEAQYREFNIGNVNKDCDMFLFTKYQRMIELHDISQI
jgi:uncharacterized protein YfbU (UPF0304 family)